MYINRPVQWVLAAALAGALVSFCARAEENAGQLDPEIAQLKSDAENGDVNAEFELGKAYQSGEDVSQNDAEALKWITMAAEHGNTAAQINLAIIYRSGSGVTMDNINAYMWLEIASLMGNAKGGSLRKDVSITDADINIARQKAREWMAEHNFKPVPSAAVKTEEKAPKPEEK